MNIKVFDDKCCDVLFFFHIAQPSQYAILKILFSKMIFMSLSYLQYYYFHSSTC